MARRVLASRKGQEVPLLLQQLPPFYRASVGFREVAVIVAEAGVLVHEKGEFHLSSHRRKLSLRAERVFSPSR